MLASFPTPTGAKQQGKTFHEFSVIEPQILDSNGAPWRALFLVSRDALKWEVPALANTFYSGFPPGLTLQEMRFWSERWQDLSNPDPLVGRSGLDARRACRLPTNQREAQRYVDQKTLSVSHILAMDCMNSYRERDGIADLPDYDPARPCLLLTPTLSDHRWTAATAKTRPALVTRTTPSDANLVENTHEVNDLINGRLQGQDLTLVGNPGKIWTLDNMLFDERGQSALLSADPMLLAGANYGLHLPPDDKPSNYAKGPYRSSTGGYLVVQSVGELHSILYRDYSQVLLMVAGWCAVHNPYSGTYTWYATEELYMNSGEVERSSNQESVELFRLATDVPLRSARHPTSV